MTQRAYHHGDLRAALVAAGVEAARHGGEGAVGLNRLATAVGVSASAAYRHFPGGLDDLLVAVGDVGRQELAERIVLRTGQVIRSRDPKTLAHRRFRSSGEAYVEYVLEQPGLFQVACRHDRGRSEADPYGLLEACIDDLVAAGALPPPDVRRPHPPPGQRCTGWRCCSRRARCGGWTSGSATASSPAR